MRHILLLLLILVINHPKVNGQTLERTFYRSAEVESLGLRATGKDFSINDDNGKPIDVQQYADRNDIVYWYRRVATEVCITGDCRPIDVGLFWDCTGSFVGLEVFKEPLTKTDHSNFAEWDYRKLMSILRNEWSMLREYALSELVDEKKEEGVDGVTGATKREIAEEAVEKAVYTTYTLWHLIHVGEKEQLSDLTAGLLSTTSLFDQLLEADKVRYAPFLLEMLGLGKIKQNAGTENLVLEELNQETDPTLQTLSLGALRHLDLSDIALQNRLAQIYKIKKQPEKVAILSAVKPLEELSPAWYNTLASDLSTENPWMAVKILQVIRDNKMQSEQVLSKVKNLSSSTIPVVQKAVSDFKMAQAQK